MALTGSDNDTTVYLAERYWPGSDATSARDAIVRLSRETEALTREGTPARPIASMFVAREQALMCVVGAGSAGVVAELGRRADVPFDRIVEAVVFLPVVSGVDEPVVGRGPE